jgi:hypothetical protein
MEARRQADYPPKLNEVFAAARDADGEDVRPPARPIPDLWRDWPLRRLSSWTSRASKPVPPPIRTTTAA